MYITSKRILNRVDFVGAIIKHCFSKMVSHKCLIAVCQLTSSNKKADNLRSVQRLVSKAAEKNAKIVFLPEACDYIKDNKDKTSDLAETLDGQLITEYKALAEKYKLWISVGGFHEIVKVKDETAKLKNTHILINDEGKIMAVYRKAHLFDVTIPEKNIDLKESSSVLAGTEIVPPIETPAGSVGLSICYDLRFPEISTILRKQGASILTFPSAFTNSTGEAHWEVLLRARAIENQCYVVAAAQYGQHNATRISYGHAMIVDPWGKIIAECPKYSENIASNESLAIASVDRNLINKIQSEMPVFEHRRDDIYKLTLVQNNSVSAEPQDSYNFGDKVVPASTVFYSTKTSFAFTNIRCVVPGHVLVSSIRKASRLQDLTSQELADLFDTAVKVQKIMEKVHSTTSSTLCVQDGKDAGQTIPHVHVHILPRKANDFERNDDIYLELAKHDRENNSGPIRSVGEMSAEADLLKTYFK